MLFIGVFGLLINLIMNLIGAIVIMCKKLPKDENYINWRASHKHAPKAIFAFSSIFSFHIMRLLYSRPLGFNTTFVRFNNFLTIFVPMNMLSIASIFAYHLETIGVEIYAIILIKAWSQSLVAFLDCLIL